MIPPPVDRNYSMDSLRVLAMLMVVILHVVGEFGLAKIPFDNYPVSRILSGFEHSFSMCAVNVYAMLTGYFSIHSTALKLHRYFNLWLVVAFYTVGIYAFMAFISLIIPSQLEMPDIAWGMLYPIPLASGYWYFNAYTVVFFLIPILNKMLKSLNQTKFSQLLIITLIAVPCLGLMGIHTGVGGGLNPVWLVLMYCAGGYIRLYPIHIGRGGIIIGLMLIVVLLILVGLLFSTSGASGSSTSMPQYVVTATLLTLLFSQTRISHPVLCRIIGNVAPLTFGVYIIHLHPCVWSNVKLILFKTSSYNVEWWFLPTASLVLFVACLLIDYCRVLVFRLCRAEVLVQRISRICQKVYQNTFTRLLSMLE